MACFEHWAANLHIFLTPQRPLFDALINCIAHAAANDAVQQAAADVLCALLECEPEGRTASPACYIALMQALAASPGRSMPRVACQLAEGQPGIVAGTSTEVCMDCCLSGACGMSDMQHRRLGWQASCCPACSKLTVLRRRTSVTCCFRSARCQLISVRRSFRYVALKGVVMCPVAAAAVWQYV